MYRSFDKNCHEMLVASGYRFIVIGNRLNLEDGTADFEVIPVMADILTASSLVFDINSSEAINLVNEPQPVGLFLDVKFSMPMAMAA
ncbi:hypothetical protein [Polluticoccus soli]|uniref:hypothetical protein n=1 Tax=Polluticoccus soli TaxID=3034150 RepID=UPI0023E209C1|nr:hypothetical protein [Flavipsychrobacter sp. JY13-12]